MKIFLARHGDTNNRPYSASDAFACQEYRHNGGFGQTDHRVKRIVLYDVQVE